MGFWSKRTPPATVASTDGAATSAASAIGGTAPPTPKAGVPRNMVFALIVGLLILMVGAKFVDDMRKGTFGSEQGTTQRQRELPKDDESTTIGSAARTGVDSVAKRREMSESEVRAAIAAPTSLTAAEAIALSKKGTEPAADATRSGSTSVAPVTDAKETRTFDPSAPTPESLMTSAGRKQGRDSPSASPALKLNGEGSTSANGSGDATSSARRDQLLKEEQEMFNSRSSPLFAKGETATAAFPGGGVDTAQRGNAPAGLTNSAVAPSDGNPVDNYVSMLTKLAQAQPGGAAAAALGGQSAQSAWLASQRNAQPANVVFSAPSIEGQVILPASVLNLVTRTTIRSDLEGDVIAVVTDDVRDTTTGRTVVIPKGSQVLGSASSDLRPGQERAYTAFKTLYFPDGRSFELRGLTGSDATGASGLPADVTRHLFQKYGTGLLLGALAYAVDRRNPNNQVVILGSQAAQQQQTLSQYAGQVLGDTTKSYIESQRNIPDLLVVPAGTPFTVIVRAPLLLVPTNTKRP